MSSHCCKKFQPFPWQRHRSTSRGRRAFSDRNEVPFQVYRVCGHSITRDVEVSCSRVSKASRSLIAFCKQLRMCIAHQLFRAYIKIERKENLAASRMRTAPTIYCTILHDLDRLCLDVPKRGQSIHSFSKNANLVISKLSDKKQMMYERRDLISD